jgi:hypothetical protein
MCALFDLGGAQELQQLAKCAVQTGQHHQRALMEPEQPDSQIHQSCALMSHRGTDAALDSVLQSVVTSTPEQVTPRMLHKNAAAAVRTDVSLAVITL